MAQNKNIILKLSTVISTKEISKEEYNLLNGFVNKEINLYDLIKNKDYYIETTKLSPPILKFNYGDKKLYTLAEFLINRSLSTDELEEFSNIMTTFLANNSFSVAVKDNNFEVKMFQGGKIYTDQQPVEPPKNYLFLKDILKNNSLAIAHQEFLNDAVWFEHLKKLCTKLNMQFKKDAPNGAALPIYKKETSTNSVIIHEKAHRTFLLWAMSKNYINGFEEKSNEHNLGMVMYHDIKFADFVFRAAVRQEKTKKDPDLENFNDEYQKALKRIIKYSKT